MLPEGMTVDNNVTCVLHQSILQIKNIFLNNIYYVNEDDYSNESSDDCAKLLIHLLKIALAADILSKDEIQFVQQVANRWFSFMSKKGDFSYFQELKADYLKAIDIISYNNIRCSKRYYIIQRTGVVPGIASHIITNLGQIASGLKEGRIPVIDTYYPDNCFTDLSKNMNTNIWEKYFGQPFGISLFDVAKDSDYVIIDGIPSFMPCDDMDCLCNPDLMAFWKKIMRKYMPLSDSIKEKSLPVSTKTLGVLARGTDYTAITPVNHPVQPQVDDIIAKAKDVMKNYDCKNLFLATEDQDILEAFSKEFGDKLIINQSIYYKDVKGTLIEENYNSHVNMHEKNIEYLSALKTLSKCDCFIGGRTSGTVVVMLLNEKFEYSYIWDLGRYGIDDSKTLLSYAL